MGSLVGRLKRRPEFLRVAAARRKWAAPGLVLQVAETTIPAPPQGGAAICGDRLRVGFTCSKKVGNAVARNRAKRRLRAIAAALLPDMAAEGYDYVLIGRAETVRRPYTLLLQDLQTALKRVGALKSGQDMPVKGGDETG
ncbi:MAG: ribonuclease P protein component [Rhodospirillaceae bacterium]|nr:ribonuclease P protein component [Rhodospirillaceae bacterium]